MIAVNSYSTVSLTGDFLVEPNGKSSYSIDYSREFSSSSTLIFFKNEATTSSVIFNL